MSSITYCLTVCSNVLSGSYLLCLRVLSVAIIALWIYSQCPSYFKSVWLAFRLPGPPAYPIVGNSNMAFDHKKLFYLGLHGSQLYGRVVRGWLTIFPVIFLFDPKQIRQVLLSSVQVEKSRMYEFIENFVGKGLVTSSSEVWRHHRKILEPCFSTHQVEKWIPLIEKHGHKLVQTFKNAAQNATPLNTTRDINQCIFNILSEFILGPNCMSSGSLSHFKGNQSNLQERIYRPWLMLEFIYKFTSLRKEETEKFQLQEKCIREFIQRRRKVLFTSSTDRTEQSDDVNNNNGCLLDVMIQSNMTDDECVNEVSTFMLAGQETVAGALAFTLHLLAKNQAIQETAAAEVRNVLSDGETAVLSPDDLRKLDYLERCLKESLRIYPSILGFSRRLTEDVYADGLVIPAGTNVVITPYATHRLPDLFPEPEVFDPDRFHQDRISNLPVCAYMPFSAGPRNCIGMKFAMLELKALLALILRDLRMSLPPEKSVLDLKCLVTLRASGGIWITFHNKNRE